MEERIITSQECISEGLTALAKLEPKFKQIINTIDGCKMKEKNVVNKKSLYVVFENINTISDALENLNRLQLIDN